MAGGGFEQVLAADDFGNAHSGIINHHGELVGWDVIVPPDHEVAKIPARDEKLCTVVAVNKGNHFAVRDSEAPVLPAVCLLHSAFCLPVLRSHTAEGGLPSAFTPRPARAWIERFIFAGMWSLKGAQDILAGTGAGINKAAGAQLLEGRVVEVAALALRVGAAGSATVRAFLPLETELTQVLDHGGHKMRPAACAVQVFIPEHQSAAL